MESCSWFWRETTSFERDYRVISALQQSYNFEKNRGDDGVDNEFFISLPQNQIQLFL